MISMVLSKREKRLVAGLGALTALLLVYFVVSQFAGYRAELEKDIERRSALLLKARVMAEELSVPISSGANRKISSLIGHIEELAGKISLKEKLQMNRVPTDKSKGVEVVDLKLDELNLDQVVSFLYLLENSQPTLVIDQFEINPSFRKKNNLRISVRVLVQI